MKHQRLSNKCVFLIIIIALGISVSSAGIGSPTLAQEPLCPILPYGLVAPQVGIELEPEDLIDPNAPTEGQELPPNTTYQSSGAITQISPVNYTTHYGWAVFGVEEAPTTAILYQNVIVASHVLNPDSQPLPVEGTVRYYLLVNESFVPIGDNGELYRDVTVALQEYIGLTLDVPTPKPGIYDVIVVAIAKPESPIAEGDQTGEGNLLSRRLTLIVGEPSLDPSLDQRPYTQLEEGTRPPGATDPSTGVYAGALAVTQPGDINPSITFDPTLMLEPNADYTLEINLGQKRYFTDYELGEFSNEDFTRFALIAFEDYHPVPIEGQDVYYGEMRGDAYRVQLPFISTAPEQDERHLMFLRIDFPGTPLCHHIEPGDRVTVFRSSVTAKQP